MSRKRVFVASPLRVSTDFTMEENLKLAQRLCHAVMCAGHAPFAPHLIYSQFMDDSSEAERNASIESGLAWLRQADEVWVYAAELGQCSSGMLSEVAAAQRCSIPPKVVFMPPEFEAVTPRKKRDAPPPPPKKIEMCLTCEGTGKTSFLGWPQPCGGCDGAGQVEV